MASVNRVRDPAVLEHYPEVLALIVSALKSNKLIDSAELALHELMVQLPREDMGLFVSADDDGKYKGFALAQWSRSAFSNACTVIHFYSEGSDAGVRGALVGAVKRYADEGGFDKVVAIDTNDKGSGFQRLFNSLGESRRLGDVFIFDTRESLL